MDVGEERSEQTVVDREEIFGFKDNVTRRNRIKNEYLRDRL